MNNENTSNNGNKMMGAEDNQKQYNSITVTISSNNNIGRVLIDIVEALKSIQEA